MHGPTRNLFLLLFLLILAACQPAADTVAPTSTSVTLLFTNDVESAYDPIPAFWLEDQEMIGGIAEMTSLIKHIRQTEPNVFLFDSGDIFTGALAKLTEGRLGFRTHDFDGIRRHGDRQS